MKRDWNLCKEILCRLETKPERQHSMRLSEFEDLGVKERVGYHVYLLHDAGLIEAYTSNKPNRTDAYEPAHLTWEGQDFLEAAKNDVAWKKALKHIAEKGGGATTEILKATLVFFLKDMLGI